MQRLHLVGLTEDADGLIFSTRRGAKSGGFVVSVDPDLLATLEEVQGGSPKARANGRGAGGGSSRGSAQRGPRASRPESLLSPREMQELLRGGWTLEEVAVEAGVDVDWVSRFAAPVMAEIRLVVDQAVGATFDKPRVGPSALPLGPSVRRNIAERGVRLTDEDFDAGWGAHQQDDATWIVSFTYTSRGKPQVAEWALDVEDGEVVAHNRLGSALGHVASTRRKVSTAPPPKPKPKASAAKAVRQAPPAKVAPSRRVAGKATRTAKTAKTSKATKATKKKATGGRKRPVPPVAVTSTIRPTPLPRSPAAPEPVIEVAPVLAPPSPRRKPDPYREELRRRQEAEAEHRAVPRPVVAAEPPLRPIEVISPTVRTVAPASRPTAPPRRRPQAPPQAPPPEREWREDPDAVPDLRWQPKNKGPMPPPARLPVAEEMKEGVAEPIGRFDEPPEDDDDSPFAAEAWFPKRQTASRPAEPAPQSPAPAPAQEEPVVRATPVFHGAQTAGRAPRRREPLRGR